MQPVLVSVEGGGGQIPSGFVLTEITWLLSPREFDTRGGQLIPRECAFSIATESVHCCGRHVVVSLTDGKQTESRQNADRKRYLTLNSS